MLDDVVARHAAIVTLATLEVLRAEVKLRVLREAASVARAVAARGAREALLRRVLGGVVRRQRVLVVCGEVAFRHRTLELLACKMMTRGFSKCTVDELRFMVTSHLRSF